MSDRTPQQVTIVAKIYGLVAGLPTTRDRFDALNLAWLAVASQARTDAMITPGGFTDEQERQVHRLRAMADFIATDEPETQRLFNEGDFEEMERRLRAWIDRRGDVS